MNTFRDQNHFNYYYGFALIITSTLLFSSKAIIIKLAYRYEVNPDTLMALRMLFSCPLYLYFAARARQAYTKPLTRQTLLTIAATCVCGYYLASILDLYGLQYINASLERLILYAYPTLVIILSALLFKKTIGPATISCIAVIYLGLLLVFVNDISIANQVVNIDTPFGTFSPVTVGSTLVFCSAIAFAFYMIGSEYLMRSLPSRLFTSYGMLATCIVIAAHFTIRQPLQQLVSQSIEVYLLAGILAIFCTVAPSFLLTSGIQKVGAATAGAIACIGPIATLILSGLFLDEHITYIQLIGFAIVICAVIALGKSQKMYKNT